LALRQLLKFMDPFAESGPDGYRGAIPVPLKFIAQGFMEQCVIQKNLVGVHDRKDRRAIPEFRVMNPVFQILKLFPYGGLDSAPAIPRLLAQKPTTQRGVDIRVDEKMGKTPGNPSGNRDSRQGMFSQQFRASSSCCPPGPGGALPPGHCII